MRGWLVVYSRAAGVERRVAVLSVLPVGGAALAAIAGVAITIAMPPAAVAMAPETVIFPIHPVIRITEAITAPCRILRVILAGNSRIFRAGPAANCRRLLAGLLCNRPGWAAAAALVLRCIPVLVGCTLLIAVLRS